MPFIANTPAQQKQMLEAIGVGSIEELFAGIPRELQCGELDIPPGVTEQEARRRISALANKNVTGQTSFLGGGFYDHFIPAGKPAPPRPRKPDFFTSSITSSGVIDFKAFSTEA